MYYRPRTRRGSLVDYIMPFLIIIAVGVIIVLLFNLFRAIFAPPTTGDAFLHLESGSVQVKMFGTDKYFDLTSDALVMQGDELLTSADSRVIVEFFDGTLMRMDGSTDVVLDQIDNGTDPYIDLILVDGKLWFNKVYKNTAGTNVEVEMTDIIVKSPSLGVFALENGFDEIVRGIGGDNLVVDILSQDGNKVVDSENVGVGQEMVFTDAVLQKYWQFQSPTVLSALSDDFKKTSWYLWNIRQDKKPTEVDKAAILGEDNGFVDVAPEVYEPEPTATEDLATEDVATDGSSLSVDTASQTSSLDDTETGNVSDVQTPTEPDVPDETVSEDSSADLGPLETPAITSVAGITETNSDGFYVVKSNPATLVGTVSGASDVVVSGYTLKKFKEGDSVWTYYANADYGLMDVGQNFYEVYAIAPDGTKSDSITIKVLYQPEGSPVEDSPVDESPADESL